MEENNKNNQRRVFVVDASSSSLDHLCDVLKQLNCKVGSTTSKAETVGILKADKKDYEVVLVDVDSPQNFDGFRLLKTIALEMNFPVIMVTKDGSKKAIGKGLDCGAQNFIIKPFAVEQVENAIWDRIPLTKMVEYGVVLAVLDDDQWPLGHNSNAIIQLDDDDDDDSSSSTSTTIDRKSRVWTDDVHFMFLQAYHSLSQSSISMANKLLKILDNVEEPELTRANVASHLRRYTMSNRRKHRTETSQASASERVAPYVTRTRRTGGVNLGLGTGSNGYHNRREGHTVAMSQQMIPNGGLVDANKPFQSLPYSYSRGPNNDTPDSRAFNCYNDNNSCLGMNIPPHSAMCSWIVSRAKPLGLRISCICGVGNDYHSAASSLSSAPNASRPLQAPYFNFLRSNDSNQSVSGATSYSVTFCNGVASEPGANSLISNAPNALRFNQPDEAPYFIAVASQPVASNALRFNHQPASGATSYGAPYFNASESAASNASQFNQPASRATSYGAPPYFNASQPAAASSNRGNAASYRQSTDASFNYPFAVDSDPITGTGGIPNYGGFMMNNPNNIVQQVAGSNSNTGLTIRNIGETEMAASNSRPVPRR